MTSPSVSVVMVACNVERFLAESIESILGQTFTDFEFIIVDFGSTDRSKAIISSYAASDTRIKFREIASCGLGEARNAACAVAEGQYLAIMDADDVAAPDRLKREVAFMAKHQKVGVLGGATEWIDARGRSLRMDHFPTQDLEIRSALVVRSAFCQPAVLIRKEAFCRVGGYRPIFAPAEDYDLWLRIAEHFEVANLDEVVLKYRIHPYQVSVKRRRIQTLCKLAAQVSASARQKGGPDPLDRSEEISPALLAELGVSEARQENEFVSDWRQWIRHMCMASEYGAALDAALEALHFDLNKVDKWQTADLHLTVARLYWRQNKLVPAIRAASRALTTRPVIAGRPLRSLMLRLGLAVTRESDLVDSDDWPPVH